MNLSFVLVAACCFGLFLSFFLFLPFFDAKGTSTFGNKPAGSTGFGVPSAFGTTSQPSSIFGGGGTTTAQSGGLFGGATGSFGTTQPANTGFGKRKLLFVFCFYLLLVCSSLLKACA